MTRNKQIQPATTLRVYRNGEKAWGVFDIHEAFWLHRNEGPYGIRAGQPEWCREHCSFCGVHVQ